MAFISIFFSWNERRRVEWRSRPYFGGPVDGPFNGPPPGTWDIYQEKPPPFVETTFHHVVPHTEVVRNRDSLTAFDVFSLLSSLLRNSPGIPE